MISSGCTYRFIESSLSTLPEQLNYDLEIRQQPERAKVSVVNERDRRSIEPPPILQLHWQHCSNEELKKCLQSPFYFTVANLVTEEDPETPLLPAQDYLSGSIVSSLYRLRDIDNSDGGFFVFGDLAVKREGKFRLRFSLFEISEGQVENRKTILSNTFTVFIPKQYPGPVEATFLSRTFSDQGVKMRIRKEHRLQSRKRKLDHTNDTPAISSTNDSSKRYYAKSSKTIVSPPSYAETSSSASSDVFFGRWQASAPPSHSTKHDLPSHRISTPPQQPCEEGHEYKGLSNKLKCQYAEDHVQAFPSPESTIYNTMSLSSCTTHSMSWNQAYSTTGSQHHNGFHGRSRSHTTSQTKPSSHLSSPILIAAPHFTDSPPLLNMPLPTDRSIAKYHTHSDSRQSHGSDRLPTPSNSMEDLHEMATGAQSWGTRLPPLRAIMSNIQQCNKQDPSLFPLLLPPPVSINQPSMSMREYRHPCYR